MGGREERAKMGETGELVKVGEFKRKTKVEGEQNCSHDGCLES